MIGFDVIAVVDIVVLVTFVLLLVQLFRLLCARLVSVKVWLVVNLRVLRFPVFGL